MNSLLIAAIALSLGEFKFSAPAGWQMKTVANGYDAHTVEGKRLKSKRSFRSGTRSSLLSAENE